MFGEFVLIEKRFFGEFCLKFKQLATKDWKIHSEKM